jgi:AraC-like DNA-binding protein
MGARVVQEVKTITDLSRSYRPHVHDELSVAYVWSGSTIARIDGADVPISGECMVVIPGGVPHACNPVTPGDWSYTLLLMDAKPLKRWPAHCILPGQAAFREPFAGLRENTLDVRQVERLAGDLLAALEASLSGMTSASLSLPRSLQAVEAFLRRNAAMPLSLEDLCTVAELSKYHLVRAFRKAYGLTPHAYQLNLRVNEAKARLKKGEDLAEAALASGFCDQSHFHRVFTRCVGMTPAAYQRAILSKTAESHHH